jgi:short-subunit dehydrogenase
LNGLSEVLQIELMEFGIRVSSIAPGRCATSFAEEKQESWHIPPSAVSDAVLAVLDSDRRVFWGTVEIRPLRRPN